MDVKDLKILQALDQNPRYSYSQIAKKTSISKETVQYRIHKLEKANILTGYWILPAIRNDTTVYKVFLKNKGLTKKDTEDFERFAQTSEEVAWFAKTTGSWTYILTLVSKEDWKISQFLATLQNTFSDKFTNTQILKSLTMTDLKERYLFDTPQIKPITNNFLDPPIKLGKTEEKIISILKKNARAKFVDIGKELNITAEAVSHSFRQITKKKTIISLKPRINHQKLGFGYYHLMLSLTNGKAIQDIENYFIAHKNAVFIMKHVGSYQIHIEIVAKPEDINSIIDESISSFANTIQNYDLCKIEKEIRIKIGI